MMHRLTFCCGTRINYCFSSSESSTSAATNAAADNADIVSGTGAVTKAGDFSDVQSGHSVRNEDSGTVLSLTEGSKLVSGVDLAGAKTGNVTVTSSDPQVLRDAFTAVAALDESFSGTVQNLVHQTTAAAAAQDEAVLSKLSELALSQQTEGKSNSDKNILYVIFFVVAAAVAGLWVWKR